MRSWPASFCVAGSSAPSPPPLLSCPSGSASRSACWPCSRGSSEMVELKFSGLKETKPHQYLVRFLFGGTATVLPGLVAKRFGPAAGGLFLAFPATFPAGVTLIESHEKERKGQSGYDGTHRGRMAAAIDAAGAAMGCI